MMGYNIDWIFPRLRNPSRFWHFASTLTIVAVGIFSKFIIAWFNKTTVHNKHILVNAVGKREKGIPLVTVSNHHSCFDDPGIWGKCIPVIRGAGVFQPAVDLCIEKLALGDWVHVFPEGRVNMTKENMRMKWGIGRILYESPKMPIIIPIWHEGMDSVLPNEPPYMLKFGKKVTINIGKPLDLNDLIEGLKKQNIVESEARKIITDKIQEELKILRRETELLHANC